MVVRGFRHGAGATIADAMASGEALEENILKSPSLILQADENLLMH